MYMKERNRTRGTRRLVKHLRISNSRSNKCVLTAQDTAVGFPCTAGAALGSDTESTAGAGTRT